MSKRNNFLINYLKSLGYDYEDVKTSKQRAKIVHDNSLGECLSRRWSIDFSYRVIQIKDKIMVSIYNEKLNKIWIGKYNLYFDRRIDYKMIKWCKKYHAERWKRELAQICNINN